ncbi:MAG: NUDIX domain-containing protein [bacterium]
MGIVVCVASIRKGKILLVKKRGVWILPGGEPENTESDLKCLVREIKEEFPGVVLKGCMFYKDVIGKAPHVEGKFFARVYIVGIEGEPQVSLEITDVEWIGYKNLEKYPFSEITQKVLDFLHKDGYLPN